MIQRIQSLYLLLIVIIGVVLTFVPFAKQHDVTLTLINFDGRADLWLAIGLALNILVTVFAFITIFSYKNRNRQIGITKILFFLVLLLVVFLFYVYPDIILPRVSEPDDIAEYTYGAFLPIISMTLMYLATKAIAKDDKLVKSADRLR